MKELLIKFKIDSELRLPLILNLALVVAELFYLLLKFKYLNAQIPLWMTSAWGADQLAPRAYIFLIPLFSAFILFGGVFFINYAMSKYQRYGERVLIWIVTLANIFLAYSVLRIINISSQVFEPLFDPRFNQVLFPAIFSFLIVYTIAPRFIEKFKADGLVTDPQKHKHPGMLLDKPSARGGGVIFAIGVLAASVFFVKFTPMMWGIFISMIFATILGYLDDVQNTKPLAKLAWLENPKYRFFLQLLVALPLVVFGVVVDSINNPLNGPFHLDAWTLNLFGSQIPVIAVVFTIIWVVWIMNLLSWSNGVDGQYSGVVGIAGLMIAIMTLRLLHFDPSQRDMMELAAIVSGAALGLLPFSWHPSKIMWGFAATAAGIVLAAISVVSQAKIATSIIVLTVPFLDGAITVTRRLLKGQSPLKGDRGHLHHLLLERGWSVERVAVFYWVTTAIFGIAGVLAADKNPILTVLTGFGLVAFLIISLNISPKKQLDEFLERK